MSDFVETMKDWLRMCQHMDKIGGDRCCDICPLGGCNAVYEEDGNMDYAEIEEKVAAWAAEHPEPVYPTWYEYLCKINVIPGYLGDKMLGQLVIERLMSQHIHADLAQKLWIEPKNG